MDIAHFRQLAVEEIADTLGKKTATMYSEFYKDKPSEVIKVSLEELLTEVVGKQQARKRMTKLTEKIEGVKN
ncbi:MAG: hypothetical protein HZC02_01795 [Candidatus Levybacteria bacterium]|nr:hypothetical protein [Candidatus Levybacteria bacterium]